MTTFLIFIAGFTLGVVATILWKRNTATPPFGHPSSTEEGRGKETLIARQAREKEEDKQRIFGLLETNTPLSVGDVKMMLDIPESSATRYFDELEKEGKVRQVGARGRFVSYERA